MIQGSHWLGVSKPPHGHRIQAANSRKGRLGIWIVQSNHTDWTRSGSDQEQQNRTRQS